MDTSKLVADMVQVLHLLFAVFLIITPFIGSDPLLSIQFITVPFVMLHWLMNNDTCCLTVMECKLRGIDPSRSFFNGVVAPVYQLGYKGDAILRQWIWGLMIALWIVTVFKLSSEKPAFKTLRETWNMVRELFT